MRGNINDRLPAVLGLGLLAAIGTSMNMVAAAAQVPRGAPIAAPADHYHNGNGRYNNNAFTIRTKSQIKGIQIVSNADAGSVTNVNNGFCRKRLHCKIRQRTTNIVR